MREGKQQQYKPKDMEATFAQGDDNDGPKEYVHQKGNCPLCGKKGHPSWECKNKDKDE